MSVIIEDKTLFLCVCACVIVFSLLKLTSKYKVLTLSTLDYLRQAFTGEFLGALAVSSLSRSRSSRDIIFKLVKMKLVPSARCRHVWIDDRLDTWIRLSIF